MAYSIQKTNGQTLSTIADGTVDNTTDLKLIGKNFAGYGEIQNENFVFLLENFASAQQPPRPIAGQIWYDSGETKLKFYDGAAWKTTGGTTSTNAQPVNLAEGDLWFDNVNQKLYIYNGVDFSFIGPQDAGDGLTQMQSKEIVATDNTSKAVVVAVVDDEEIAIFSNTNFTIKDTGTQFADYAGFVDNNRVIKKGITLKGNDENGINTETLFYGTATNATKLGGIDATNYVRSDQANFAGTVVSFDDNGINIGNDQDLSIVIDGSGGNEGHLKMNQSVLKFSTYNGATYDEVLKLEGANILPGGTPVNQVSSRSLGSVNNKFLTVHAETFQGTADRSNEVRVGNPSNNEYITASYTFSGNQDANTLVARDDNGNIAGNEFFGVATQAKYADLAEIYKSENGDIPVGTIVAITGGPGDTEIGPAQLMGADPIGIISDAPAYLMNSEAAGQAVGLVGRVPMLVKGHAKMGSMVYLCDDEPGIGTTEPDTNQPLKRVGYVLEEDAGDSDTARLIECFIKC